MPARELPVATSAEHIHTAATTRATVRVHGTVVERGDGRSGRYRNVWLSIRAAGTHLRVTATSTSRLGTAPVGTTVDLAARLTGMLDVTRDEYYGERAQLLDLPEPASTAPPTA